MKKRVLAAMSGGVDSSAAAALLVKDGVEVVGATMRLLENNSEQQTGNGIRDAKAVCDKLGIEHHVVDLRDPFRKCVVDYFVREYSLGRTPNPCIHCNRDIKFGALLDKALELGCTHIATGHYASITDTPGGPRLSKAANKTKDQSYFLYSLKEEALRRIIFPLSAFSSKEDVRQTALELGFSVAQKPDSQDVCFIAGNTQDFLQEQDPTLFCPGDIVLADTDEVVGRHKGIAFYTVGQRKGLGVAWPTPLYIAAIDAKHNRLLAGAEPSILTMQLTAKELSFPGTPPAIGEKISVKAKIRYAHKEADALVTIEGNDRATVHFSQPQRAVTPGQAVVFYAGDLVLGGGIIDH